MKYTKKVNCPECDSPYAIMFNFLEEYDETKQGEIPKATCLTQNCFKCGTRFIGEVSITVEAETFKCT